MISFRVIIACVFAHRKSAVIIDFAEARVTTWNGSSGRFLGVCVYVGGLRVESTTLRTLVVKCSRLACEAAMFFECRADFGGG